MLEEDFVFQRETQEQGALTEAKANEIAIAEMQYKTTENALRECIDSMMEIVSDASRVSDDDANLMRMYLREIEGLLVNHCHHQLINL